MHHRCHASRQFEGVRSVILSCVLLALVPLTAGAQTTWYVDYDACPGVGTGSELDPFCKIQDAVDAAATVGDEIRIVAGTYLERVTIEGKSLYLHGPDGAVVTIIHGMGEGTVIDARDVPDPGLVVEGLTVVGGHPWSQSGGGIRVGGSSFTLRNCVIAGNRASSCGGVAASGGGTVIEGCTFYENTSEAYGGAICAGGWPAAAISDCTFRDNVTGDHGGAIYGLYDGSVVQNCTFTRNAATNGAYSTGGAIYGNGRNTPVSISECTFVGNEVGYYGGAIHIDAAIIERCTFDGNSSQYGGGAVHCGSDSGDDGLKVSDTRFTNNSAGWRGGAVMIESGRNIFERCTFGHNSSDYIGGGLMARGGEIEIADCLFQYNIAEYGGGCWCSGSAEGTITRSVFEGNRALNDGGGFREGTSSSSAFGLYGCVFTGNRAGRDGGGVVTDSDTSFVNCTFTHNRADNDGDAIVVSGERPLISNSVFRHNAAPTFHRQITNLSETGSPLIRFSNIQLSGGSSNWDVELGEDGGGNIDVDPQFVRMPFHGGDGWGDDPETADVDESANDDFGDLRVLARSPGVDAGTNEDLVPAYDVDLDGAPRLVDDPCHPDSGAGIAPIVDMGAYEYQVPATCGDGTCDADEDCASCPCDCGSCCGNGTCDVREHCLNCAADCSCETHHVPADYLTIQAAIDAAENGDEIVVAPGTYPEAIDLLGKAIHLRSADGPEVTTIDAGGIENVSVVTCASGETSDTTLEGFTITGGLGTFVEGELYGGGIYIYAGGPTITNCVFHGAETREWTHAGGGMYNHLSRATVTDCVFEGYQTVKYGAGMYNMLSDVVVSNCTFRDLYAWDGDGIFNERTTIDIRDTLFSGSPMDSADSSVVVTNCQFSAGGMYGERGSAIVTDCRFEEGWLGLAHRYGPLTVTNSSFRNARDRGLRAYRAPVTLTGCVFEGNDGGGAKIEWEPAEVTDCVFRGNRSSEQGAGLYINSYGSSVANSLFVGNHSLSRGGGLLAPGSNFSTANCSFVDNVADDGGGIYLWGSVSEVGTTVRNSILWGNVPDQVSGDASCETIVTDSIVEGGCGTILEPVPTIIDADPIFVRDPDDGGDGWGDDSDTTDVDEGANDDYGDLHVHGLSPAIDAGNNEAVPPEIVTDLDGAPRVADHPCLPADGTGGPIVDLGPYEVQAPGPGCGDGVCDGQETCESCACDCCCGDGVCQSFENCRECPTDCGGCPVLHVPTDYATIQAAIDVAPPLAEVIVAPGVYREAIDFVGKSITVRSAAGPSQTAIDASGLNTSVVKCISGETEGTVLDGFTITGGGLPGWAGDGAGMRIRQSAATVRNCVFGQNHAQWGGGVFVDQGIASIENCSFNENRASSGGGIGAHGSRLSVTDCEFRDNRANHGAGIDTHSTHISVIGCSFVANEVTYYGGGVFVGDDSVAELSSCVFESNTAERQGGAVMGAFHDGLTLRDCHFQRNSGSALRTEAATEVVRCTFEENTSDASGGAIDSDGQITIANSSFIGNVANEDGGALHKGWNHGEAPTVSTSVFIGNRAGGFGGAIRTDVTGMAVTHSAFVGNTAGADGGALAAYGTTSIILSTLAGNVAAEDGGAVVSVHSEAAVTLANSVVWGNHPARLVAPFAERYTAASYCSIQGGYEGAGNIAADPMLARPPDHGGDGWGDDPATFGVDESANDVFGDVHLRSGSPCIDAGDNEAAVVDVLTDLDGEARFADDPCTADTGRGAPPVIDMGVFEFQPLPGCGDGVCSLPESCVNCACDCGDCCGDGTCDVFETRWSCPADCACVALHVPDDYATIQEAIDAALGCDQVIVAPGTYSEPIDLQGKAIHLRASRGPGVTTIDASSLDTSAITCTNNEGPDTLLEGFTIEHGIGTPAAGLRAGGAMYLKQSGPTVRDFVFRGNSADNGGAVFCSHCTVRFIDCTFVDNVAKYGGGVYCASSRPVLSNCRFERNVVTTAERLAGGGAVYNWQSPTSISSCMFVANSAPFGGAIFNVNAAPVITGSTFADNQADTGHAIYNTLGASSDVANSILWNHAASLPTTVLFNEPDGSMSSISYSNVRGSGGSAAWDAAFGTDGGGNVDAVPAFVQIPSDGGDGWRDDPNTTDVDEGANDDFGDLRLGPDSPCTNAGDPAFVPEPEATDLDGHGRVLCSRVDMGAYEFGIGDYDCDATVVLADFAAWALCLTAPGDELITPECMAFDFDADLDVDLQDYAGFQTVFDGP